MAPPWAGGGDELLMRAMEQIPDRPGAGTGLIYTLGNGDRATWNQALAERVNILNMALPVARRLNHEFTSTEIGNRRRSTVFQRNWQERVAPGGVIMDFTQNLNRPVMRTPTTGLAYPQRRDPIAEAAGAAPAARPAIQQVPWHQGMRFDNGVGLWFDPNLRQYVHAYGAPAAQPPLQQHELHWDPKARSWFNTHTREYVTGPNAPPPPNNHVWDPKVGRMYDPDEDQYLSLSHGGASEAERRARKAGMSERGLGRYFG